jgi:hypothetical protein
LRIVSRQDTSQVDLDNDITGAALKLDHMTGVAVSVKLVSGGQTTGTFTLEATASDPFTNNVYNVANPEAAWTPIDGSAANVDVTNDTEVIVWNVEGTYYRGIRLMWEAGAAASGPAATYFTVDWSAKGPQS